MKAVIVTFERDARVRIDPELDGFAPVNALLYGCRMAEYSAIAGRDARVDVEQGGSTELVLKARAS